MKNQHQIDKRKEMMRLEKKMVRKAPQQGQNDQHHGNIKGDFANTFSLMAQTTEKLLDQAKR